MVNARLGNASGCHSLIFGGDGQVAAIVAVGIAAETDAPAEAEGQRSTRIESGYRRQVAGHLIERDLSPVHGIKLDPGRQIDTDNATRLAVKDRGSDHRAGPNVGDGPLGEA